MSCLKSGGWATGGREGQKGQLENTSSIAIEMTHGKGESKSKKMVGEQMMNTGEECWVWGLLTGWIVGE